MVADGYTPSNPEQRGRLGRSSRSFRAKTKIDMPKTGEVQVAELQLLPIRPTTKADFDFVGCAEHDPVMRASVDETDVLSVVHHAYSGVADRSALRT